MAAAVIFMQWDSYEGQAGSPPLFEQDPLTFTSRQERLHHLGPGDRLWLVSRCPVDRQYYFVAALRIRDRKRNPPGGPEARAFGEFAVLVDRTESHDLGKRFPAEGLLRALQFDPGKPIRHGASIGQALQTLRLLSPADEQILEAGLGPILSGADKPVDRPCGLWTKCAPFFANYFLTDWRQRRQPQAFLLYDPPPAVDAGMPVFIHSDNSLRLLARFLEGQFVAGHKFTTDAEERLAERERVWNAYRAGTMNPETRADFDSFWDGQHGVRGLFLMDQVTEVPKRMQFKVYGRALEWGYPTSVGYRYLSRSQCLLLLRASQVPGDVAESFLGRLTPGGT